MDVAALARPSLRQSWADFRRSALLGRFRSDFSAACPAGHRIELAPQTCTRTAPAQRGIDSPPGARLLLRGGEARAESRGDSADPLGARARCGDPRQPDSRWPRWQRRQRWRPSARHLSQDVPRAPCAAVNGLGGAPHLCAALRRTLEQQKTAEGGGIWADSSCARARAVLGARRGVSYQRRRLGVGGGCQLRLGQAARLVCLVCGR